MRYFFIAIISLSVLVNAETIEYGEEMIFDDSDCGEGAICGTRSAFPTSIVALLGSPESWNEKSVSVVGYIQYDLHGTLLFMSSEHCSAGHVQYSIQTFIDHFGGLEEKLYESKSCTEARVEGIYYPDLDREFEPETITIRQRPGYINVEYIVVYGRGA